MTTIRERLELGENKEWIKKWYKDMKGNTPMCCFSCKKQGNNFLWTCTWLKKWYRDNKFKEKCLQCQEVIKKKLEEGD